MVNACDFVRRCAHGVVQKQGAKSGRSQQVNGQECTIRTARAAVVLTQAGIRQKHHFHFLPHQVGKGFYARCFFYALL